jgi:diguanylate cyclase (GGDEF)-like protein
VRTRVLPSTGVDRDPTWVTARASSRAEHRHEVRRTTLVAGAIALAALPAWTLFDRTLVPASAGSFLAARLVGEGVVAVLWLALLWRRTGARWPTTLSLLTVSSVALAIAWMVPRASGQVDAYLLGLSLPIFTTGFLVVWRWWMGTILSLVTAVGLAVSAVTAPAGLDRRQVTTAAFYLGTAAALSLASQVYRDRQRWQHHLTQAALDQEQRRNESLVEELELLSRQDPLTSLANRRAFEEHLTGAYLTARRSHRPLSLLVVDVDRFKEVNDLGGHVHGDSVLRAIAAVLDGATGPEHFVARLGGDEFAIVCPDTSLAQAVELAAGVHEGLREMPVEGALRVTCSIGAAELERGDASTASLYRRADAAMYEAKVLRDGTRCAEPGAARGPTPAT